MNQIEIRSAVELPSRREPVTLLTQDNLKLVAELALPVANDPVATLVMLHPLPTAGGFMDSHIYRKAANRLPALADLAVLRFNTRGTESPHGKSEGEFDGGKLEKFDVTAAVEFALSRGLPNIYLVGWSFGTDLALRHAKDPRHKGLILLSPPLRTSEPSDLQYWNTDGRPVFTIVPELDDYLQPPEAAKRFAVIKNHHMIAVDGAKHLWVGEPAVNRVLTEITQIIAPNRLPLPTEL